MKFQKFTGTDDKGRRSDFADGVSAITSSSASKRDAAGMPDMESLAKAIAEINAELESKKARIAQIEARLVRVKAQLKESRIQQPLYRKLCDEKTSAIEELVKLREEVAGLKVRKIGLQRDITAAAASDSGVATKDDRSLMQLKLLRNILLELRRITSLLEQGSRPTDDRESENN